MTENLKANSNHTGQRKRPEIILPEKPDLPEKATANPIMTENPKANLNLLNRQLKRKLILQTKKANSSIKNSVNQKAETKNPPENLIKINKLRNKKGAAAPFLFDF